MEFVTLLLAIAGEVDIDASDVRRDDGDEIGDSLDGILLLVGWLAYPDTAKNKWIYRLLRK